MDKKKYLFYALDSNGNDLKGWLSKGSQLMAWCTCTSTSEEVLGNRL